MQKKKKNSILKMSMHDDEGGGSKTTVPKIGRSKMQHGDDTAAEPHVGKVYAQHYRAHASLMFSSCQLSAPAVRTLSVVPQRMDSSDSSGCIR